jgi:hypothetical protein
MEGRDLGPPIKRVERGRVCEHPGCFRPHSSHGLCRGHGQRLAAGLPMDAPFREKKAGRVCGFEGCARTYYANGWCNVHYQRARMGYEMDGPIQVRDGSQGCSVSGCTRKHQAHGLCATHRTRQMKGTPLDAPPHERDDGATRHTTHGYVDEKRAGRWHRQHRLVMEDHIGRPLRKDEEVHHLNGVRDDNRLANLELWSKSHPYGQRVEDKVEWAIELLRLYRPDALA